MSKSLVTVLSILALTMAEDCKKPWNYCWMNSEWKPIQEWYSLATFVLGIAFAFIWCIGVAALLYLHLRFHDQRKLYEKALNQKVDYIIPEILLHNQTNESIVNKKKQLKVADISKIWDIKTSDIVYGSTFKGRNWVMSNIGISTENIWKNEAFQNKLRRINSLKWEI